MRSSRTYDPSPPPASVANRLGARTLPVALALTAATAAAPAHASFLSGEALDTAADWLAWFVIVLVPIVGITVFWIVHVMPEKIAHKRHHPQRAAIQTLCLLSLVFGGLLWPIAWLWAYTRPVMHRMAYGTDLHEDYFVEQGERAKAGELLRDELAHLRTELQSMEARGALPPNLANLRDELEGLAAQYRAEQGEEAPKAAGGA